MAVVYWQGEDLTGGNTLDETGYGEASRVARHARDKTHADESEMGHDGIGKAGKCGKVLGRPRP